MEQLEIIEPFFHPTDWVNSLVLVEKPGKLRVCLDPKDLNRAIKRPYHTIPNARQIADRLSNSTLFTVLDLSQAYHQIQLDEASSDLCCFNTPYGRYRYRRLPFGISCASDIFQIKNEQIFGHIHGCEVISDELLIHSSQDESHDDILTKVLDAAKQNNVTLNEVKIQFKSNSVRYMGDIYTGEGMKADNEKIKG